MKNGDLTRLAALLLGQLLRTQHTLVTAESCTAGMIAATLARVPGMSKVLAGGFVVYQVESKVRWLGLSQELIDRHDVVSREVAEAMAVAALDRTPHATIALSVTGHLGPDAPVDLDGIVFTTIAIRGQQPQSRRLIVSSSVPAAELQAGLDTGGQRLRVWRQQEVVRQVLQALAAALASTSGDADNPTQ
jgi:PncC family amidohydrolase